MTMKNFSLIGSLVIIVLVVIVLLMVWFRKETIMIPPADETPIVQEEPSIVPCDDGKCA
jgi:hypothetical protein